jgi:hypothetical protein
MRRRVDNARAVEFPRRAHEFALLVVESAHMTHREPDVRPVEVADHHHGIPQAQPAYDFLPDRRRGGRGQGKPGRRPDRLRLGSEPHVVGAEVAAPLADQVSLINGEQARPGPLHRLAGLPVRQLLGREEDERAGIARGEKRGGTRAC